MVAQRSLFILIRRFAQSAVAAGRNPCYLFEGLRKIAGGGEAAGSADDREGVVCGCQQLLSLSYAGMHEIVDGGDPIFIGEGMHQIIFVYMEITCQLLEGEIVPAVLVDVASHGITEVGRFFICRAQNHGKIGLASEKDDQNFHQILADGFIAGGSGFNFPEHHLQIEADGILDFLEIYNAEVGAAVFHGKLQPLDSKDDIFQWIGIKPELCVGDIGVDHHQIVGGNGENIVLYLELPDAVNHIEELGAVVGMGHAEPVAAVGCGGNV